MDVAKKNKVLWFLWGNPRFTASSRIHGLAIHKKLVSLGYNSHLAFIPKFTEEKIPLPISKWETFSKLAVPGDIIVLQKLKDRSNLKTIGYFKKRGLKTFLIDCDLPVSPEIGQLVDNVICTSKALCKKYGEDGVATTFIEDSPELYASIRQKESKETLKCFWFGEGDPPRWREVMALKEILKDERLGRWELITISNHLEADIPWDTNFLTILKKNADIVAIPIFEMTEESTVKSANRLLQAMALSIPVICSRLPSYEDVAATGNGAIFCNTKEDWVRSFLRLQDAAERNRMRQDAFHTARPFSLDKSIEKWIAILQLSDSFKLADVKSRVKTQAQINRLFYHELIRKNITYFFKTPISLETVKSALHYAKSKIV